MSTAVHEAVTALVADRTQAGEDHDWDESIGRGTADALRVAGWLGVGLDEKLGGEGGELSDAVDVIDAITTVGWPSPAADLLLVSNGLLSAAGLSLPVGQVVVLPELGTTDRSRISASARNVAWGPWATHFLVVCATGQNETTVAIAAAGHAEQRVGRTLHSAPRSDVRLSKVSPDATAIIDTAPQDVLNLVKACGALARAVQSLAALRRVRDLTVEHVRTREQFGRPLARFQAVQQHLATLLGEVAAAEAAVTDALRGVSSAADLVDHPRLATARVRVGRAAEEVSRLSHQLHGAIGTTREYELHRHTLALLAWREEFGTEREWALQLATAARNSSDLWSWLLDEI